MYKMLDGNAAAVEAMKLARVQVIAAYPITPQSAVAEKLSSLIDNGEMDAQYIRVESEHTAMSACVGAALCGVRPATATSSVGLALMHEVLGMAAGNRLPIVMPVVNRALPSPWSLWCEHGDSMAERDTGWIQFYCQNVQEVLDLTLIAYKAAENKNVLTPVMVCYDGFFLSHSMQKIDVPDQKDAYAYVGEYVSKNAFLDTKDPMFVCDLTGPDDWTEIKYQQKVAMDNAFPYIQEAMDEYKKMTGRGYSIVEEYKTEDADAVLVAAGSMCGTAKYVVNQMREQGKKVGLLKLSVFRPFPAAQIFKALNDKKVIGVFDRSAGIGGGGPIWCEVAAQLKGPQIRHFVGGLGGRDVPAHTIEKIFVQLLEAAGNPSYEHTEWIDLKPNPFEIREVLVNVSH